MSDYRQAAIVYEQLRQFARENNVAIFIAAQLRNPHREPIDIGMSWEPMIIYIDYMKILP